MSDNEKSQESLIGRRGERCAQGSRSEEHYISRSKQDDVKRIWTRQVAGPENQGMPEKISTSGAGRETVSHDRRRSCWQFSAKRDYSGWIASKSVRWKT